VEDRLLFDFAGTSASNLGEFQCMRTHVSLAECASLESASRAFFEQARAGEDVWDRRDPAEYGKRFGI
jgi:hypothetical protein